MVTTVGFGNQIYKTAEITSAPKNDESIEKAKEARQVHGSKARGFFIVETCEEWRQVCPQVVEGDKEIGSKSSFNNMMFIRV